jgi:DNA modification methylase
MPTLDASAYDSIVTDPPYGLSFMGKSWDHGVPGVAFWTEALRGVQPGGYLLAFGGTRTYHRLAVAIEDAGFQIQDCLSWLYGSGFPKHKSKLKPAWEPIIMARKPAPKATLLNIDACRIPATDGANFSRALNTENA